MSSSASQKQTQTNQQVGVSSGVGVGAGGSYAQDQGMSVVGGGKKSNTTAIRNEGILLSGSPDAAIAGGAYSTAVSGIKGSGNVINITTADIAAMQANERIAGLAITGQTVVATSAIEAARMSNESNLELLTQGAATALEFMAESQQTVANLAAQTSAGFQQITALAAPQSDAAQAELLAAGETPLGGVFSAGNWKTWAAVAAVALIGFYFFKHKNT